MTKYTRLLLFFSFFVLVSKKASAQDYQSAIGLKFGGYENGLSLKYFTNSTTSLEGEIGFRQHGVVVTGLYELNVVAFGVPELKFYYGAGAHIGDTGRGQYQDFTGNDHTYNSTHLLLGADAVVGLDYLIPKSPIAVSVDLNPRLELLSGPFLDIAPGIGVKYTF